MIDSLRKRGVVFSPTSEGIRYRAPTNAISFSEIGKLRELKSEVLAEIRVEEALSRLPPLLASDTPPRLSTIQETWLTSYRQGYAGQLTGFGMTVPLPDVGYEAFARATREVLAQHTVLRYRGGRIEFDRPPGLNEPQLFEAEVQQFDSPDGVRAAINEFLERPFPVESDWLIRAKYISIRGRKAVGLFSVHHLVFDRGSAPIFTECIQQAIFSKSTDFTSESALQYSDYSEWDRRFHDSEAGKLMRSYWEGWRQDMPVLRCPVSGKDLSWERALGRSYFLSCSEMEYANLARFARRRGGTVFTALLSIFAESLGRWADQDRFWIRTSGDLRASPACQHMIGPLFCWDYAEVHRRHGEAFPEIFTRMTEAYTFAMSMRPPARRMSDQFVRPDAVKMNFRYDPLGLPRTRWTPSIYAVATGEAPPSATTHQREQLMCPIELRPVMSGQRIALRFTFCDAILDAAACMSIISHFAIGWQELLAADNIDPIAPSDRGLDSTLFEEGPEVNEGET